MNLPIAISILVGILATGGVALYFVIGTCKKDQNFAARQSWDDHAIEAAFATLNVPTRTVLPLLRELAETLEVPYGKLRPTDRFDVELAPAKGFEYDDPVAVVPVLIERRFKKSGLPVPDLSAIKTVADYIVQLAPTVPVEQSDNSSLRR